MAHHYTNLHGCVDHVPPTRKRSFLVVQLINISHKNVFHVIRPKLCFRVQGCIPVVKNNTSVFGIFHVKGHSKLFCAAPHQYVEHKSLPRKPTHTHTTKCVLYPLCNVVVPNPISTYVFLLPRVGRHFGLYCCSLLPLQQAARNPG